MAYTPAMILTLQQVSWSLNKTTKRFSTVIFPSSRERFGRNGDWARNQEIISHVPL